MKTIQFGFAGGEISRELWSRLDVNKYQIGSETIENFVVLPHGPLRNRPGWEHVGYGAQTDMATSTSKLVEMRSAIVGQSSHVLEFSPHGVYVYRDGQVIVDQFWAITGLQTTAGITAALATRVLASGHSLVNGDRVIINVPTRALGNRLCVVRAVVPGVSFIVTTVQGIDIDSSDEDPASPGTAYHVMKLAGSNIDYSTAKFTQKHDVLTVTCAGLSPVEYRRSSNTSWAVVPITFLPDIATPAAPTVGTPITPTAGSPVTYYYRVTAIKADTLEESLPSPASSVAADLTIAGHYIGINPIPVTGAIRYNVYKLFNGLYGFIAQTDGGEVRDNNITPDVTKTIPIASLPFTGVSNYPTVCTYFQGRRIFANTANYVQNFWATRSGTESNLSYSLPSQADDAIAGALNSNQVQAIQSMLQLGALVFVTSGGVWRMASDNEIVTPSNAFPVQQSEEGGNGVSPITTEGCILYVTADGERLNKGQYSWQQNSIVVENASALAPHLFAGYQLTSMAFRSGTDKAAYIVRNDGTLLGFTFSQAADVLAWSRHVTQGVVVDVCSSMDMLPRTRTGIVEGSFVLTPTLYAIVDRDNGRFIERACRWDYEHFVDAFIIPRPYSPYAAPSES